MYNANSRIVRTQIKRINDIVIPIAFRDILPTL